MLILIIPVIVAVITAGPAWFVTARTRKENTRDHNRVVERLASLESTIVLHTDTIADRLDRGAESLEKLDEKVSLLGNRVAVHDYKLEELEQG